METNEKYKNLVHELSEFCKKHKLPSGQVGYLTGLFVKHEQLVKKDLIAGVVISLPTDSREFTEWQQSNDVSRLTGGNDYTWGGFIYEREFFLEKFMEAQNNAN